MNNNIQNNDQAGNSIAVDGNYVEYCDKCKQEPCACSQSQDLHVPSNSEVADEGVQTGKERPKISWI
ncbi:MAG TPA: hypothetical protein PJ984_00680 [Candidatus Saccharibacteria bacterium]|nr:hypothetical protein [Candidatus Saccharibacteria bacterium]